MNNKLNEEAIKNTSNYLRYNSVPSKDVTGVVPSATKIAYEKSEEIADNLEDDLKVIEKQVNDYKSAEDKAVKKYTLDESLFTEDEDNGDGIYYASKRDPLVEVIQDELTWGETVYKITDGKKVPTTATSLNLDPLQVGYREKNGKYIIFVTVSDEDVQDVLDIANKYGKPTKVKKDDHITGEYKNEIQIILDDEDVFEPYVGTEPTVKDYTSKYGKVAMRKKSQGIA